MDVPFLGFCYFLCILQKCGYGLPGREWPRRPEVGWEKRLRRGFRKELGGSFYNKRWSPKRAGGAVVKRLLQWVGVG